MATHISRRTLLRTLLAGAAGLSASGWFPALAQQLANQPARRRHFILLWMSGGPSQTDTFDLKPGHANGGEFKEIATQAPGLRFSEHLPKLAAMSDRLAVIRGLNTKEGDHGRGTFLMRTGYKPMGPIDHPSIGSSLANQLGAGDDAAGLPAYVSVGPFRAFNQQAFGPGFLGPRFGPLVVGAADNPAGVTAGEGGYPILKVQDIAATVPADRMQHRLQLWNELQSEFLARHAFGPSKTHNTVYRGALHLMNSKDASVFDLAQEPAKVREAYGPSVFGQGCLLARRLIERGVSCVEVSLGTNSGGVGWDTHGDNFNQVRQLSQTLDSGWATLMQELHDRGLLDSTTILWMGEFGRTPQINQTQGRDHFPNAWSCVLAGGGIAGGQAYGRTSPDGMQVVDGQTGVADVLATLCQALGVPAETMQMSNSGRPIRITEGTPIQAVLT